MAGSYKHAITKAGRLRADTFTEMIENLGDAWEMAEEMYGMIWYLAESIASVEGGSAPRLVEVARQHYKDGLAVSPGVEE